MLKPLIGYGPQVFPPNINPFLGECFPLAEKFDPRRGPSITNLRPGKNENQGAFKLKHVGALGTFGFALGYWGIAQFLFTVPPKRGLTPWELISQAKSPYGRLKINGCF